MSNKFFVGIAESMIEEGDFCIVSASNTEEAINKFIEYFAVRSENLMKYVYDKSINMSFAAGFWFQTKKENKHFQSTGEKSIKNKEFKHIITQFFGEHRDFAKMYLDFYFSEDDYISDNWDFLKDNVKEEHQFPAEFFAYIWKNSNNWAKVVAFDLTAIEEIN
jgi:hypothetical protein